MQSRRRFEGISTALHMALCMSALLIGMRSAQAFGADATNAAPQREALVIVKGVATPFSVFGLIHQFREIPGIEGVTFDLSRGLADLRFKPGAAVSDDDIRRVIRDASYTPGPIRWK